ncbi:Hsp20/alpha crystallin family protein [bacterium]|nr:Hsp20/alpha crystallin family protein [bacterium]
MMEREDFNLNQENFEIIEAGSKARKIKIDSQKKILSEEEEGRLTVDVYQTDDEIVIVAPVAGVDPDDLDISLSGDMITIKGKREMNPKENEVDYLYQECFWGSFSRTIILPSEIDPEKVKATLKEGILKIHLPKVKKEKVKKIKIVKE